VLYWFVVAKNLKAQNVLVFIASYIFYGWWDWRFLFLMAFSTIVDYFISLAIHNNSKNRNRRLLLIISLVVNIGLLGFFKYFNFFIDNAYVILNSIGLATSKTSLNIILPVGISFYTFQTMSYTIDVYRKHLEPTKDFIAFGAFVSFFPQLVAGPIERAVHLLPQFKKKRTFNYHLAIDGTKQILWGLFKKIVIADKCGELANLIFDNSADLNGSSLILGAVFFSFQIYGDFSGYSDIAIGVSKLLGIDLMQNFAFPYFSRDIAEFWRRWHISLSTWFRDYLYIPLGGSRGNITNKIKNTLIIFLVSGLWHGPNWTFVFWGLLNALYFLPLLILNKNRTNINVIETNRLGIPSFKDFANVIATFSLVSFAWIFFRAESLTHAFQYINGIFHKTFVLEHSFTNEDWGNIIITLFLISFFTVSEWYGRFGLYGLQNLFKNNSKIIRWSYYSVLVFLIVIYYHVNRSQFIYFQF
jgi:alginate O-acetyltransferase complex protein AlgI